MAPPRHRGRGFSRRIQYGLFFGYVVAAIGVVVALGMVLVGRFDPVAFAGIRGLALDATTPFATATRPLVRGGAAVTDDIGGYFGAVRANRALRAELEGARRTLIQARVLQFENARLKRALRLIGADAPSIVTAQIVGSDLSGSRRFATIAAGSAEGVATGQPVRAPDGLIGRIAEVGAHAARIVLLTDGGSVVPLRVTRTGDAALGEGTGDGLLDIRDTVSAGAGLRRGDLLVTSGVGGVYPPDLPVAVVLSVAGEVAKARPLADPGRLDYALVLTPAPAPPPVTLPAGRSRR